MLDVRDAVIAARNYVSDFRDILPPTSDMRLEETELDSENHLWTVILSFAEFPSGNHIFKRFSIDADSGKVYSMRGL